MIKDHWKRFVNYEKGLALFFIISIFFDIVNEKFLNSQVPAEIIGYMFWLTLGLYLGFRLCKYEFRRVWAIMHEEDEQKK